MQPVLLHDGLRCYVRQMKGSEAVQYQRPTAVGLHRMYCNVKDITADDVVLFNSRLYDILAVNNPGQRDHHLEIDLEQKEVPTETGTTPSDHNWST